MKCIDDLWDMLVSFFASVPSSGFVDICTPAGTPNLAAFDPGMWRMGQPTKPEGWKELPTLIGAAPKAKVVVVKLNDESEGDDSPAEKLLGWTVVRVPIPPEDGKPWTVVVKPSKEDVGRIVKTILDAHASGAIVVWHCTHGRDRTGLISALVGMKLLGWTKKQAWDDMIAHGFRWELPDLDAYWLENVE